MVRASLLQSSYPSVISCCPAAKPTPIPLLSKSITKSQRNKTHLNASWFPCFNAGNFESKNAYQGLRKNEEKKGREKRIYRSRRYRTTRPDRPASRPGTPVSQIKEILTSQDSYMYKPGHTPRACQRLPKMRSWMGNHLLLAELLTPFLNLAGFALAFLALVGGSLATGLALMV